MQPRNQRFPSDLGLRITHDGELCRAELVNISSSGARLKCSRHLPEGALVLLQHLNTPCEAEVVWSNDRGTGVRFTRPLSPSALKAISLPEALSVHILSSDQAGQEQSASTKHESSWFDDGLFGAIAKQLDPMGLMICFLGLLGVVLLINLVTDTLALAPLQIPPGQSETMR